MEDRKERIGSLLKQARKKAGFTQTKVANKLGLTVRTIQNWELGDSIPSFDWIMEYFKAIGVNPTPYLKRYLFPNGTTDLTDKKDRLHKIIDEVLTDQEIDIVYYLLSGEHKHSVYSYLQKVMADLQCNMFMCQSVAWQIYNNYKIIEQMNAFEDPNGPRPDMDAFTTAIDDAIRNHVNKK